MSAARPEPHEENTLQRRGEPHGLSAEEVAAADRMRMDLARYAALRGIRRIPEMKQALAHLDADNTARADAEHQLRVEQARQALTHTTPD